MCPHTFFAPRRRSRDLEQFLSAGGFDEVRKWDLLHFLLTHNFRSKKKVEAALEKEPLWWAAVWASEPEQASATTEGGIAT